MFWHLQVASRGGNETIVVHQGYSIMTNME
jgi:hypothetical protein